MAFTTDTGKKGENCKLPDLVPHVVSNSFWTLCWIVGYFIRRRIDQFNAEDVVSDPANMRSSMQDLKLSRPLWP